MSARDNLIELFDAGGPHHLFSSEEVADNILELHAHELAEQIRTSKFLRDYTDDHMSDCNAAADEIDPEVEK